MSDEFRRDGGAGKESDYSLSLYLSLPLLPSLVLHSLLGYVCLKNVLSIKSII